MIRDGCRNIRRFTRFVRIFRKQLQREYVTVVRAVNHLTELKAALQDIREGGIEVILREASIDCFFLFFSGEKVTLEEKAVTRRKRRHCFDREAKI